MKYHPMNSHSVRSNNAACPKCACMTDALQKAGVDTTDYLSLRINKSCLPADAELVIQLRDKRTGELIPVNLNDENNTLLGKNSRFYGQVMADGFIFNPYIHRRFIAKQFRELVRRYGVDSLEQAVLNTYHWKYALDMLRKEVHKLAMLERHDKDAFAERSRFFSLSAVTHIIADYVNEVQRVIDEAVRRSGAQNRPLYIAGFGCVERQHIRPTKYRFDNLYTNAAQCRTFARMDQLLEAFEFVELYRSTRLPGSFVQPFLEAGAFYTMKHAIMFEGKLCAGCDQQGSLRMINQAAKSSQYGGCLTLYRCERF